MGLVAVALQAFFIGFSGALTPGPLLTVVIARSSTRGVKAAALLSVGHALLELLVVVLFIGGLSVVFEREGVRGVIGLVGGAVLVLMGAGMVWSARRDAGPVELAASTAGGQESRWWAAQTLGLGALVSATNPYWIGWWATVGAALATKALAAGRGGSAAFYLGHISSDFAWYLLVGLLVARGARRLNSIWYTRAIAVCGVGLAVLGVWFIKSGWGFLHLS
jgi:threonine/homoserine/homoserine lactone efflux protein